MTRADAEVPRSFVAASANPHKVAELRILLAGLAEITDRPSDLGDVPENGETLEANAAHKALVVARAVGRAALADDSGLEVDALGGAPGVRSARYAGPDASDEDNRDLLLSRLTGVARRSARFRTVLAVAQPDGSIRMFEGSCEGRIAERGLGDGGFGYDPVFVPDEGNGRTFAEMTPGEKNLISHRARAVAALADWLSLGE